MVLLEVFQAWRGGLGREGTLPFSGGYAEQPAAVMAALRYMASCAAKLEQARPRRDRLGRASGSR